MFNPIIKKVANNLTVVIDHIPYVQSASIGLWSKIGSRLENSSNSGMCHFLEHMVFKGTKTRTSQQISNEIESKGGYVNAYTSKEKTAWYAKVLNNDVPMAMDIIFDIICNSTFLPTELEKERGVILEEINMYLDDPQDIASNLYDNLAFANSSLARPIIGTKETVSSFLSEDFINHCKQYYYPSNMVLAISGNVNINEILELANKYASVWPDKLVDCNSTVPTYTPNTKVYVKPLIEQANLIYGLNGYSYKHNNFIKLKVLNTILGGGMSSKLWLKIREEKGLAYSVHSYLNAFSDIGSFCVGVGCDIKNVNLVIELINNELHSAVISNADLQKAKNQLKSSSIMGLENIFNRCNKIASNILDYGEVKSVEQYIEDIDKVTINDITKTLAELLSSKPTIALVASKDITLNY